MSKITKPQMRKLYATAKEKGVNNELLHDMVMSRYKKEHISDLTVKQAASLIDSLETGRTVPLPTGRPLHLATEKQIYKIHELEKVLNWDVNPARLRGFLRKYAGNDNVKWLTKEQAWRVIEGLKSIIKQEQEGGGNDGGTVLDSRGN